MQVSGLPNTLAKVGRHRRLRRSGAGPARSLPRPKVKCPSTANYADKRPLELPQR